MKNTVLVVIGLVAALGPLLMIAGQVATVMGALAGTALAAAAGTIALTVGIAALVAVPLFLWWKSSSEAATKAREQQEELTAQFAAAGDEATTLVSRTKEVVAAYKELVGETENATDSMDDFMGASVLAGELIDRDVAGAFYDLGIEAETLESILSTGTDVFQDLAESAKASAWGQENLAKALREADPAVRDVTSALADQLDAGTLTNDMVREMLISLDETADAFDNHREELDATAKEYLNSSEALDDFAGILGTDVVASLVDAANENGNYAGTVDYLRLLVERETETEKKNAAAKAKVVAEEVKLMERYRIHVPLAEDLAAAELEAAEAAAELTAEIAAEQKAFDDLVAAVASATDETFAMSSLQDSLAQSSRDLFDALVESETGLLGVGEAAENARAKAEAFAGDFAGVMAKMAEDQDTPTEMAGAFLAMKDEMLLLAIQAGATEDEIALLVGAIDQIPAEMDSVFRFQLHIQTITEGMDDILASQLREQLAATGMLSANFGFGATGGIVSQPTLSLIGEAGPEAVIPLNQMPGASPLGSMGGMGGAVNVTVNVGGSIIGQDDLVETIQRELIRTKNRNGSLEF
jgi:ABC-type transporter Mla subunit MlaD